MMANHYYRYYRQSRNRSRTRKSPRRSTTWLWILIGMFIGVGGSVLGYMFLTDQKPSATRLSQIQRKPSVQKTIKKEKGTAQRFEFYTLLPGMEIQLPDANSTQANTTSVAKAPPPQKPTMDPVPILVQPQASPAPPPPSPIRQTTEPKSPASPVRPATTLSVTQTSPPVAHNTHAQALQTTRSPHANASLSRPTTAHPQQLSTAAQYIVQAGIFQELQQADALKARLTLQGFNTKIQKVQTQGYTWFRVTLGPFASESLALNQKRRLEAQKIQSILILQRPNS